MREPLPAPVDDCPELEAQRSIETPARTPSAADCFMPIASEVVGTPVHPMDVEAAAVSQGDRTPSKGRKKRLGRTSRDFLLQHVPHLPQMHMKLPDPHLGKIAAGTKSNLSLIFGGHHMDPTRNRDRQFAVLLAIFCLAPCVLGMWFGAAVFFPPAARENRKALLWTDGVWVASGADPNVTYPHVYPTPSVHADGYGEIACLVVARLSGFALYAAMGNTFLTKCHGIVRALSHTMVAYYFPLERFHKLHSMTGLAFGVAAGVHALAHVVRIGLRSDWLSLVTTGTGLTGVLSTVLIGLIVIAMTSPLLKKAMRYETRMKLHWLFLPLIVLLFLHHFRTFYITLVFALIWALDYCFVFLFRTYRLDSVEFTRLADGGVQVMWQNPAGFNPRAGEYVKILIPWIHHKTTGGKDESHADEWHPFSLYVAETSNDGIGLIKRGGDSNRADELSLLEMNEDAHRQAQGGTSAAGRSGSGACATTQIFVKPAGDWSNALSDAIQRGENVTRSCWVRGPFISPYSISASYSNIVLVASGIGITPALGVLDQFGSDRTCIVVWMLRSEELLSFFAPMIHTATSVVVYYTNPKRLSDETVRLLSTKPNVVIHNGRTDVDSLIPNTIAQHTEDATLRASLASRPIRPESRGDVPFEPPGRAGLALGKALTEDLRGDEPFEEPKRGSFALRSAPPEDRRSQRRSSHSSNSFGGQKKGTSSYVLKRALSRITLSGRLKKLTDREREAWCALYCGNSQEVKDKLKASARQMRIGWESELFHW